MFGHLLQANTSISKIEGVDEVSLEHPLLRILLQSLTYSVDNGLGSSSYSDPKLVWRQECSCLEC